MTRADGGLRVGARRGPADGAVRRRAARPASLSAPVPEAPVSLVVDRLFAYGTLMTGSSRRPLLGDAVLEGEARVRGSVYDFGDYPGVVLDDGGWVRGELYRVPDLEARLPVIDRAEWYDPADEATSLYLRRRAPVIRDGAASRDAWVYVYNPTVGGPPRSGARIESGDWRAHLAARAAIARQGGS